MPLSSESIRFLSIVDEEAKIGIAPGPAEMMVDLYAFGAIIVGTYEALLDFNSHVFRSENSAISRAVVI